MILIHSIVEGGAADLDSRLRVGDRLVHVNHTPVQDETLEFTVDLLTSIPLGSSAIIGVNHPLPNTSDTSSNACSPLSPESAMSRDDYTRTAANEGGVDEEEEEEEADDDEDGFGGFSEQSTVVGGEPQDVSEREEKR